MASPLDAVLGQDAPISILNAAVAQDRLASAYLFFGPAGIGKTKTALAFAEQQILRAAAPESRGDIARRIALGHHPDARVFRPRDDGARNLSVAVVREQVLPHTQFAPFEAPQAFMIFPEADVSFPEAHPEAANALLKTLEEPRPGVHFILIAEQPDRLLQTIRSRCQRIRFSRLGDAVLTKVLDQHEVPEERRRAAIALAEGSASRALALSAEGVADALVDLALAIDETARRRIPGEMIDVAEQLAKRADLGLVLESITTLYRDLAAIQVGVADQSLAFRHRAADLRARAEGITPDVAGMVAHHIAAMLETFESNANRELAIAKLLSSLRG